MSAHLTITEPAFTASIDQAAEEVVVKLTGIGDAIAQRHFNAMFSELHSLALRQRSNRVRVDIRELSFMNSSCIKEVIVWIEKVRKGSDAEKYSILFLSSSTQPWQRRTLGAITHFAKGVVGVEVS